MRSLLDVNILVALTDPDHVHHARAHRWWQEHGSAGWASCAITQNGMVRVLSLPKYPRPLTIAVAVGLLRRLMQTTNHQMWGEAASIADDTRFDTSRLLGHNQITDVYLLGLAVRNGGRLVTLDARVTLAAVREATVEHLHVV